MSGKSLAEEVEAQKKRGVLLVLTGPTGVGKDTILNELHKSNQNTLKVITTTSRQMRHDEEEKKPYHFLSREVFMKKIEEHAFFEWVEFRGEFYGTQKETLMNALATGKDVLWRIDTRGMKNIKEKVRVMVDRVAFVFMTAPIEILFNRVKRDEGEKYLQRWNESIVRWEMEQYDDGDYLVYNKEGALEKTITSIFSIMESKRLEIHKSKEYSP
jgi:guanylate kinase